ncbi:MAG: carbohydrate ABC transporter permease [Erysipelotrichaceae bacterium]|nr:carbohydrate ABC transporter permease [Erysipelotrichaceae bacterium]
MSRKLRDTEISSDNHTAKEPISIGKILMYVVLFAGALVMIFPFYWMITGAFKSKLEVNLIPPTLFPENPFNLENFIYAFKTAPFAIYFRNSLIALVGCIVTCSFTTILAAYAFSRLRFPGRELIFSLLLSLMMVPYEMIIITNYRTIVNWKLHNTIWALILPFMSSIFYTYILKGFFDSVPESLYQAAKVDGCSDWKYLWRVMVPMAKSSLATIILLNAIATWNSFLWPMIATNSKNVRTLPFGLYAFMTEGGQRNERMMAASTIVVIPMIIVFLFARKYIISGMSRGGIKG